MINHDTHMIHDVYKKRHDDYLGVHHVFEYNIENDDLITILGYLKNHNWPTNDKSFHMVVRWMGYHILP